MGLPPGPLFLSRLALRSLPTSVALYGSIRLLVYHLSLAIPAWLTIVMALLTQLSLLVSMSHWRSYRDRSAAVANDAVLVPQVQEGGLSIMSTMVKSVVSGYPGDSLHRRIFAT